MSDAKNTASGLLTKSDNSEFIITNVNAEETKHKAVMIFIGSQGTLNPRIPDKLKRRNEISMRLREKTKLSDIHRITLNVRFKADNWLLNLVIYLIE